MKTEIYVSEICGLCYGSSTAINKTRDILKTNNNVVIYKELLHNKNVMQELNNNGAILKNELDELTSNDLVIIRAHGEPYSTFEFLKENNIYKIKNLLHKTIFESNKVRKLITTSCKNRWWI